MLPTGNATPGSTHDFLATGLVSLRLLPNARKLHPDLEKQFPDLRRKVMGALQRADIDGWGKQE